MSRALRSGAGLLACLLWALPLAAQESPGFHDPLLDRMTGTWVMRGTIAGGEVTHDLTIDWVLAHNYVRIHEVARERDAAGAPAYEAIVFIGWDEPSARYVCLWLDVTGGSGLTPGGFGYAERGGDSLPFVFMFPDNSPFHTTFAYRRPTDTWVWRMDAITDHGPEPFARVTLTRR